MQGESRVSPRRRPSTREATRRRNVALATVFAGLSTLAAQSTLAGVGPVNAAAPLSDVAEWFDEVDPAMVVDQSGVCMAGPTNAVYYRGDRIVMRPATVMLDGDVRAAVNTALNRIYGTSSSTKWATTIERIEFPQPPAGPAIRPVLSVSLKPRPGIDPPPHEVVELARQLRGEPGIETSPDYGLTPSTPYSFFWPDGYARPVDKLTPPRTNVTPLKMPVGTPGGLPVGTGTKIEVYDVGLAPRGVGVLPNVSALIPADNEVIDANGDLIADYPAAGHGLAIGGVIATLAPGAVVQEARVSDRTGLATDVTAARRMTASLRNMPRQDWPSVVVNAFGTNACDFNTGAPGIQLEPLGLKAVVEVTDRFDPYLADGFFIVASAGNQNSSRPTYPAAFESVLGVGALDTTVDADGSPWTSPTRTGPKADFSNYGDWVDAWTSGVALPTHHVSGVAFEPGLPVLDGKGEVDGTSFAAPAVAALIAEQMSITGLDARDAWESIEATGAAPLAECGSPANTPGPTGVAVALASMSSGVTATTPGSGNPVIC